jgi:hypothetical protein
MNAGILFGRGLSFPPRLGRHGGFAWSEGPENIREAIRVLLLTESGERVRRPEFGGDLRRLLFEPNTTATRRMIRDRIEQTLSTWEPRITVESVDVEADPGDGSAAIATITYLLVATQQTEQIDLRLPMRQAGAA